MNLARIITLALAVLLAACGGNGDDEECRPDFVGPPAPGFEQLPVCTAQGGSRAPIDCARNPGSCS